MQQVQQNSGCDTGWGAGPVSRMETASGAWAAFGTATAARRGRPSSSASTRAAAQTPPHRCPRRWGCRCTCRFPTRGPGGMLLALAAACVASAGTCMRRRSAIPQPTVRYCWVPKLHSPVLLPEGYCTAGVEAISTLWLKDSVVGWVAKQRKHLMSVACGWQPQGGRGAAAAKRGEGAAGEGGL